MVNKKEKGEVNPKKPVYLVLLVVAALLIGAIVLNKKQLANTLPVTETSPTSAPTSLTPTVEQYQIVSESDGAYTNYKYGFRLKYPKNLFIKYEIFDDPVKIDFFTSKNLGRSDRGEKEKYPNDIFFSILTVPSEDMVYKISEQNFQDVLKYRGQVGKSNSNCDALFKNLELIQAKDKTITINYSGPDLYTEENIKKLNLDSQLATCYSKVYGLYGSLHTDKMQIGISFTSANKDLIDSNLILFENIVNSIEFIMLTP